MPQKHILVTGGCGFIGSQFIKLMLESDDSTQIVNLDLLTYAGDPSNVGPWADSSRYRFVHGDIRDVTLVDSLVPEVDARYSERLFRRVYGETRALVVGLGLFERYERRTGRP